MKGDMIMSFKQLFRNFIALLAVITVFASGCAFAEVRTPQPIQTIPDDQIDPIVEGQHHYLLLCTDVWHGNPSNLGNTDGIVLVTLDTRAHRVMLTSFIRDALVYRKNEEGNYGIGRINYIAKNSSPEYLCEVISEHINVKVEKYILFDFSQIQDIIDACGGVDITINSSENDYLKRYAIPRYSTTPVLNGPGTYHFRGHSAVIYMRIRKAGGGGDFMRTQRVRTVLSTLADGCREMTYDEAKELLNTIVENNTMTNMTLEEMVEAMDYAYGLRDCTVEELRLPPDGAATPINYANMAVQEIDWDVCREAMADYLQNSFLVLDDEDDLD